jgi:hypothetical protein
MGTSLKWPKHWSVVNKRALCAAKPRKRLGKIGYRYFSQHLQYLIEQGTNSIQDTGHSTGYFKNTFLETSN